MRLALFDFDGTLTLDDSFVRFVLFGIRRRKKLFTGLFRILPCLVRLHYRNISIETCKETVLAMLFKGMPRRNLEKLGTEFARTVLPAILDPRAMERLREHRAAGDRILVATASYDVYMTPWCTEQDVELVCSRIAYENGLVNGKLRGPHCNKEEKARRITEMINLKEYDRIFAYGDTSGDQAMLDLATDPYYRTFPEPVPDNQGT